jgi:tryptophanyl-tRNA synthetase
LFVQSHRPEVQELAWILMTVTPVSWVERTPTYKEKKLQQADDINHGLLTYPILQAADILLPKASVVPVGKDQAAHLELSREIARSFNNKFGDTFPEPEAVFTTSPVVLGTDGEKKMSKSIGNTIDILGDPALITKQVMGSVTDTKRPLKSDPGHPEACNVCQLHKLVSANYEELWHNERAALTGCADMKRLLAERLIAHYAPARERYNELLALPHEIDNILGDGAARLLPIVTETMREVKEKVGLA